MRSFSSIYIIQLLFTSIGVASQCPNAFRAFHNLTSIGVEVYDDRPDILSKKIEPKRLSPSDPAYPRDWEKTKKAMFVFLAEALAFHEGADFYFLARDAEYINDMTRILLADSPLLKNIHILNVSSEHLNDSLTSKYLHDAGLSSGHLKDLKQNHNKAVLIDVGFHGGIFRRIKNLVPQSLHDVLVGHYMISTSGEILSSSFALGQYSPLLSLKIPMAAWGEIKYGIENLPHFTNKSRDYSFIEGKFRAVSPNAETKYKLNSLDLMADIKATMTEELRADWLTLTKSIREIKNNIIGETGEIDVGYLKKGLALERAGHRGILSDIFQYLSKDPKNQSDLMKMIVSDPDRTLSESFSSESWLSSPHLIDFLNLVLVTAGEDSPYLVFKFLNAHPILSRNPEIDLLLRDLWLLAEPSLKYKIRTSWAEHPVWKNRLSTLDQ